MRKTTGAILAGGKSTRMGQDKALVAFRDAPMIDHVSAAIAAAGIDGLVVGRKEAGAGLPSVMDRPGVGGGPAVGLLTAFETVPGTDVFLVAVDQPMLRPATIRAILGQPGDAVVPMANGHPQVTCALYRNVAHPAVADMLDSNIRKLRRLLDVVDTTFVDESTWASWGEDGSSWLSLDTPQAVKDAEDLR